MFNAPENLQKSTWMSLKVSMPVTRGNRVNVSFDTTDPDYIPYRKPANNQYIMDVLELDDSVDTIDITCGVLQAKLHRQRFICPGINRDCIEYDGKLMTPKTFYILADKGSLKDWKNAIRINGKKIRRYIDSGLLDFYNHKDLCTGRCKSRLGNKTSMLAMDLVPVTNSHTSSTLDTSLTTDSGFNSSNESLVTDSYGEVRDIKPDVDQLNAMMGLDGQGASSDSSFVHPISMVQSSEGEDEDQTFWRAIVQLGLIDEFFREIKTKLDSLKVGMIKNYVNIDDAKKASLIVHELGMRSKLDLRLDAHKTEFDRQRAKLEKEMEQLKKKVSEYEQKQEILKRKSDCYQSLMSKKLKSDESTRTTFTFETSTGSAKVVNNPEYMGTGNRSRSITPTDSSINEVTVIQKQRDILVSKKRKADDIERSESPCEDNPSKVTKNADDTESDREHEVLKKVTIDTPRGPTTVLVNQDVDSESSGTASPFPIISQDTSTEASVESSSQESSIA